MRSVDGWPEEGPVRRPTAQVTVGGTVKAASSVSVSASVSGGDGVATRTAEVSWVPADAVARRQVHPLSAGVPRRGDAVTVAAGESDANATLLTGRVDTTDVEVPGGASSELVDSWSQLDQEVTIPALLGIMPPYSSGSGLRNCGLTAAWPTQRALSMCGFQATPPTRHGAALSASLNGSLWAETGSLRDTPGNLVPQWLPSPWGECPEGFTAVYGGGDRSMTDGPLEMSLLIDDSTKTLNSQVDVIFSDGNRVRLLVQGGGLVAAQYGTTPSTVATLNTTERAGNELVRLTVTPAGAWSLESGSVVKTGTRTITTASQGVPSSIQVAVPTGGRNIGGISVAYTSTPFPAWKRTAVLDSAGSTIRASRAFVNARASDILASRASAEQARMWIDADGVFRWVRRDRWGAGMPVASLTDVDLLGYGMRVDFDSAYSAVKVKALDPTVTVRRSPSVTLHEGARQSLSTSDDETTFIEVPSDEDWPMVDSSMDVLGQTGTVGDFNRSRGTWGGATRVTDDGEVDLWGQGVEGNYAVHDFGQVNLRNWRYRVYVNSTMPTSDVVETRTVRLDRYLGALKPWRQWDAVALPIVRGWCKTVWSDVSATTATGATGRLPVLTHDVGWWVQDASVTELRDWLAARYAAPTVLLRGLSIVPDSRIELGDVLDLTDSTYTGITARVVVSGIRYSASHGEASMSLDVEVLSLSVTERTYATVQAEADGSTYAAFQALVGSITYTQQEAG